MAVAVSELTSVDHSSLSNAEWVAAMNARLQTVKASLREAKAEVQPPAQSGTTAAISGSTCTWWSGP